MRPKGNRFENNLTNQLFPCGTAFLLYKFQYCWSSFMASNIEECHKFFGKHERKTINQKKRKKPKIKSISVYVCVGVFQLVALSLEHLFLLDFLVHTPSPYTPPLCGFLYSRTGPVSRFSSWPLINCSYYPHDIVERVESTTMIHYKEIKRSNYRLAIDDNRLQSAPAVNAPQNTVW